MKKPLIILTGPTAVGKTSLSIKLAQKLNTEIISADSIQIYKYMDIGSAKVTKDEMDGVKHHLIDTLDPSEEFNVSVFKELALKAAESIWAEGKTPIIAGGTGFYIQAILKDVDFVNEEQDQTYRHELETIYEQKGTHFLFEMLSEVDAVSAATIHENNVKRVIRALEFYKYHGYTISEHNEFEKSKESPYNYSYFVLNDERERLYSNIDKRVDIMINNGLVSEVKSLLDKGYGRELTSMQGIGYKEIVSFLMGEISLDEAVYIIKRDSRHYAKRQITWFKREPEITWINKFDFNYSNEKIIDFISDELNRKGIK